MSKQLITREQLQSALEEQGNIGRPLGECLLRLGYVSHRDLTVALSEQHGLPWLGEFSPSADDHLLSLLPKRVCQAFRVFPVEYRRPSQSLVLVLGGPFESTLIPMFRRMLQCEVHAFLGEDAKVRRLIQRHVASFPDEQSHRIHSREDTLMVMVRDTTDFRRSLGARRMWIDRFKNTLWIRCEGKKRFANLFLEFEEDGLQGITIAGQPAEVPRRTRVDIGLGKNFPIEDAEIAGQMGDGRARRG